MSQPPAYVDVQQQLVEIRAAISSLQRELLQTARDALDAKKIAEDDQAKLQPLISTFNAGKMAGRIFFVLGGILSGVAATYAAISVWFTGHIK